MAIVLTPQAILLLNLWVQNVIMAAMDKIGGMTPEEVNAGIHQAEIEKHGLMNKLDSH